VLYTINVETGVCDIVLEEDIFYPSITGVGVSIPIVTYFEPIDETLVGVRFPANRVSYEVGDLQAQYMHDHNHKDYPQIGWSDLEITGVQMGETLGYIVVDLPAGTNQGIIRLRRVVNEDLFSAWTLVYPD
jgi:hypothetical protein